MSPSLNNIFSERYEMGKPGMENHNFPQFLAFVADNVFSNSEIACFSVL